MKAGSGQTRTEWTWKNKFDHLKLENVALYDIANSFLKEYDLVEEQIPKTFWWDPGQHVGAMSSTLKFQSTVKCWKVDLLMSSKTKSGDNFTKKSVWPCPHGSPGHHNKPHKQTKAFMKNVIFIVSWTNRRIGSRQKLKSVRCWKTSRRWMIRLISSRQKLKSVRCWTTSRRWMIRLISWSRWWSWSISWRWSRHPSLRRRRSGFRRPTVTGRVLPVCLNPKWQKCPKWPVWASEVTEGTEVPEVSLSAHMPPWYAWNKHCPMMALGCVWPCKYYPISILGMTIRLQNLMLRPIVSQLRRSLSPPLPTPSRRGNQMFLGKYCWEIHRTIVDKVKPHFAPIYTNVLWARSLNSQFSKPAFFFKRDAAKWTFF